jgi:ribosomal protein L40E
MPEALTESFCERCGTRYEFAAPTELNTLRKTRGLISGLRIYIMSQDSLSDAVGDAIRSEEETLASAQLDAFHDSFSFCIQCRQYTCVNCWNDEAGRCRTCVPIAGTDDLIERFEASFSAQHPAVAEGVAELDGADLNRRLGVEAWPTEDLSAAATNGSTSPEWPAELPEAGPVGEEVEPAAAEPEPEPEPVGAEAEPAQEPELQPMPLATIPAVPEPTWPDVPVVAAEAPPAGPAWEGDAPFALEPEVEPEPVAAEVEPVAEPEPVAAEVEPVAEPVAAEVEPEPVVPAPRPIMPISETILHMPRSAPSAEPEPEAVPLAAEQDDPALAARRAQLDLLGLGDPGEGPVGAGAQNVLPYRSSGAGVHPAEMAARQAAGMPGALGGSFWEASAREVAGAMTNIGVQACGECGLSLSASARFCRRCGTPQARSA